MNLPIRHLRPRITPFIAELGFRMPKNGIRVNATGDQVVNALAHGIEDACGIDRTEFHVTVAFQQSALFFCQHRACLSASPNISRSEVAPHTRTDADSRAG